MIGVAEAADRRQPPTARPILFAAALFSLREWVIYLEGKTRFPNRNSY